MQGYAQYNNLEQTAIMIAQLEFHNFRILRDCKLPLGPCTLLVGPNGSGKSTVLMALNALKSPDANLRERLLSTGLSADGPDRTSIITDFSDGVGTRFEHVWAHNEVKVNISREGSPIAQNLASNEFAQINGIRTFTFSPSSIAAPVTVQPKLELLSDGGQLAGVLDRIRDESPERFESLSDEMRRWLPDYDRITFSAAGDGKKAISLRTRMRGHAIAADALSHGTLFALAMITLAYLPQPPSIVAIEEPDHGVHPRLLPQVRDSLHRLAYPQRFGESRAPVQVVATSHSPYFLDLFRDSPSEVVVTHAPKLSTEFNRLSDWPDIEEIIGSAPLGEVWFSGILGGVPVGS